MPGGVGGGFSRLPTTRNVVGSTASPPGSSLAFEASSTISIRSKRGRPGAEVERQPARLARGAGPGDRGAVPLADGPPPGTLGPVARNVDPLASAIRAHDHRPTGGPVSHHALSPTKAAPTTPAPQDKSPIPAEARPRPTLPRFGREPRRPNETSPPTSPTTARGRQIPKVASFCAQKMASFCALKVASFCRREMASFCALQMASFCRGESTRSPGARQGGSA